MGHGMGTSDMDTDKNDTMRVGDAACSGMEIEIFYLTRRLLPCSSPVLVCR
ncbi:unnamed protein product [Musa acuminata subsp. malaccensis]|uniref:(wild Malaysian banana) hypothetical protein n=1 Tax=Musa acuminata subsp. malaccensis TaxID=214687 RepID=A0A8D7F885_MUSAM|nr:unnamed protein product [Musa acuminata subsp. malaccensis]